MNIRCRASEESVRMTSTGVARGLDVDFRLSVASDIYDGEATVVPSSDPREQGYVPYGAAPCYWLDGETLGKLRSKYGDRELRLVLAVIAAACVEVAGKVGPCRK